MKEVKVQAQHIFDLYINRGGSIGPALEKREEDILKKYYGFYLELRHTLEEIAQIYGITRERVRQIKYYSIKKLENENKINSRLNSKSGRGSKRIPKEIR